ncbi:glycoside hydrolase family 73 protein [Paenibacillus planticolens]|uniref:Mannosyl-glycoprotein endo-beta-N-acetylglucosamidase n=1 Tax=Paenibacillus planticolens TaxID=2654976 RepID=A0ABX1ZEG4_9BACL|nr:glucosaminidase domain-containing protein [Paenibacillus planticolens]NOU98498.1 mannosyl-glycoprotein endo-beta-N-acetylglucosamidase [Paenibacillus planticolens]
MTRAEFVAKVAPVAVKLFANGSPIFPSIRIAQALLETGGDIPAWNNLVGFKVGSGVPNAYWRGRSVSTRTWEVYDGIRYDNVVANWRAYDTIDDCFRDQDLLFATARYERVRNAKSPSEQAAALYACGYATDPFYAGKIVALASQYVDYDKEVTELKLDPGVAQTVINTWISPAWHATNNAEQRDYIHWLANELRKAAGLPQE